MINILRRWRYWLISLSFPVVLIAFRMGMTHSLTYGFYFWNLFLAVLPLLASTGLDPRKSIGSRRNLSCLVVWLAFLPNAPYLITDMIHFQERPPFPVYIDEAIVYTAAWNGVLLAYVSIIRVERWLLTRYAQRPVDIFLVGIFLLTGLGVYLGRFERWNSWDMLVHPFSLCKDIGRRLLYPVRYRRTWAVSILFGGLLMAGYMLLRNQIQGRNTVSGFRQRTRP